MSCLKLLLNALNVRILVCMYHASYVIKLIFLRSTVQNFSFVMNDEHAVRSFGFCRTAPNADTALVSYQELNQFANRASRFCPSGHDVESSVARGVLQVAQPRGRAPSVFRRRRTRTLPRCLLQCTGENVYFNEETNSRQLPINLRFPWAARPSTCRGTSHRRRGETQRLRGRGTFLVRLRHRTRFRRYLKTWVI